MVGAHGGLPPMAVRAADLALANLLVDRGKTAAVPRESRDRRALGADVIELEDDRIAFLAVDARISAQDVEQVGDVPCDVRIRVWPCRSIRHGAASPPTADRGSSPMTVRADDLAPRDLRIDGLHRRPIREQLRDARRLLADVIELQDDRVALAAVDARGSAKVVEYVLAQELGARDLRRVRLATVQIPARTKVRREA